ncbi:MAG: hypothetical protein QE274_06190 [Verrucomicrobiaceae bacterium]|nr:hypothetical protein [Verrucomicrobiaceae bacterium]
MKTHTFIIAVLLSSVAVTQAAPFGWGKNSQGQMGDGTSTDRATAVATLNTGALSGRTVTAIAGGDDFTLALTSDGKVYTWGNNNIGQLGDGTTNDSFVPVAVDMTGVLSGKTITAIAAGSSSCYALGSDGKVYAWGSNYVGALGDGTGTNSSVPVAVDMTGVMSGKTVTAIAGAYLQGMALTSDGKVFSWGANTLGVLGDGTTTHRASPVAVDMTGVMSGKTIVAIAMAHYHGVAVSSAGRVYTWGGYGSSGTLGDGLATDSLAPVAVDRSGVLSGKSIVAVATGQYHTLALSSDGLIYSWGYSAYGELGDGAAVQRNSPVAVDTSGFLATKTVTAIDAGLRHSMALTSDGLVCAWGSNASGQLGNGSGLAATSPTAVDMSGAMSGLAATAIGSGNNQSFALASSSTSTITPASRFTYAADFGWLNWRWSAASPYAPAIESASLHGMVYSANVGWIDLGDGTPTSGIRYSQTGQDYGVNHDGAGALVGYAYGANIGWVRFAQTWNSPPRVNLTTGAMSGYAYSANCGWIHLGSLKTRISPGKDSDVLAGGGMGDGIADSWELDRLAAAGLGTNLNLLGTSAGSDYDNDGISDLAEYIADTNPFSASDRFAVTNFTFNPSNGDVDIDWTGSTRRIYTISYSSDLINWQPAAPALIGGSADFTLVGPPVSKLFFRVSADLPLSP